MNKATVLERRRLLGPGQNTPASLPVLFVDKPLTTCQFGTGLLAPGRMGRLDAHAYNRFPCPRRAGAAPKHHKHREEGEGAAD